MWEYSIEVNEERVSQFLFDFLMEYQPTGGVKTSEKIIRTFTQLHVGVIGGI